MQPEGSIDRGYFNTETQWGSWKGNDNEAKNTKSLIKQNGHWTQIYK